MRDLSRAVTPVGRGALQRAQVEPVSIHLRVRFRRNGAAEVVSANELPGNFRLRTRPTSSFVYEIQSGSADLLVLEPVGGNPFEGRGADDPERRLPPATFEVETSVLPLKLPATAVARALSCGIRVSLYQIDDRDPIPPITPETIESLRPRLRLVSSGQVSGPELSRMVRRLDADEGRVERFGT